MRQSRLANPIIRNMRADHSDIASSYGGSALGGGGGGSSIGGAAIDSISMLSKQPSNFVKMQMKIKCSKAFQKKEQKELSSIMQRISVIVDQRKDFDNKQKSKLQDVMID
mmetsp:Transcript_21520/g.33176  ORF Transcript_21520/g.33176 Transcript_21520/m.33176 type:complete len:110 (+) Transcript_21520:203-532(+)